MTNTKLVDELVNIRKFTIRRRQRKAKSVFFTGLKIEAVAKEVYIILVPIMFCFGDILLKISNEMVMKT